MNYAGKSKKRNMMVTRFGSAIASCFLNIKAVEQVLVKNCEFRKYLGKWDLKCVWQDLFFEKEDLIQKSNPLRLLEMSWGRDWHWDKNCWWRNERRVAFEVKTWSKCRDEENLQKLLGLFGSGWREMQSGRSSLEWYVWILDLTDQLFSVFDICGVFLFLAKKSWLSRMEKPGDWGWQLSRLSRQSRGKKWEEQHGILQFWKRWRDHSARLLQDDRFQMSSFSTNRARYSSFFHKMFVFR